MQNICKCHKYEARPPRDPKEPKSDAWDEALWPRVTQQRKKENCFSPESNVIVVAPLLLWFCLKPPFDSQRWQDLWNLSTTWLDSACRCGCGLHWGLWLCYSRNGSCPALSFSSASAWIIDDDFDNIWITLATHLLLLLLLLPRCCWVGERINLQITKLNPSVRHL